MSADAGKDIRDMLALQAKVKDLSARLVQLESAVARLSEKPANPARGLAALADKIDGETPGKVPAYETAKLEAATAVS